MLRLLLAPYSSKRWLEASADDQIAAAFYGGKRKFGGDLIDKITKKRRTK